MIWNYNQRPHQALLVLVIFAVLIIILLFITQKVYSAETEATAALTTGWSPAWGRPFISMDLSASIGGLTLYGGSRIDLRCAGFTDVSYTPGFGPMRSVYSIGLKYEWRFIEVGWKHECTHRGDYSSHLEWVQMYRPTEDDIYIIFRFTTGSK